MMKQFKNPLRVVAFRRKIIHILKLTTSYASLDSPLEGVELLMDAIKKSGYEKEVKIGMDVAASEFLLPSGKNDVI